jgi:hypothetical protein
VYAFTNTDWVQTDPKAKGIKYTWKLLNKYQEEFHSWCLSSESSNCNNITRVVEGLVWSGEDSVGTVAFEWEFLCMYIINMRLSLLWRYFYALFAKLRKTSISFVMSVCPFERNIAAEAWNQGENSSVPKIWQQ